MYVTTEFINKLFKYLTEDEPLTGREWKVTEDHLKKNPWFVKTLTLTGDKTSGPKMKLW